jgi:hypothetical protein
MEQSSPVTRETIESPVVRPKARSDTASTTAGMAISGAPGAPIAWQPASRRNKMKVGNRRMDAAKPGRA